MAWVCVRCQRKIYSPQKKAKRWGMWWKYVKKTQELTVDMESLHKIRDNATVTHLYCDEPEVEGFTERMKRELGMPADCDHPLLM